MKPTRKEKEIIRHRIYERSGGRCEECGKAIIEEGGQWSSMHLSHTKSKGAGGDWSDENLRGLCMGCHMIGIHNPKSVPSKGTTVKTVVLLLVAGCAVASLAETPKVPAAPPVIPDALQKNFFKAQTHFIQANAEMQAAVDAMNQACGEYALQMNPAGDPVCIPRPKIEKPAETPKPKK